MGVHPHRQGCDDALWRFGDLGCKTPIDQPGGQMPTQVDDALAGDLGDERANLGADARKCRNRLEEGKEYFRTLGHRSGALVRGKVRP